MIAGSCTSSLPRNGHHMHWLYLLILFPVLATASVEEPDGYRMDDYDAEVPEQLTGAITVSATEVLQLQQTQSALVVDVIPEHRRPDFLPKDQIWLPVDHKGVPGALWLPDTGFGALSPVTENYLRTHLSDSTGEDLSKPLVFYCRADCWMSWNAAKRALGYGYTRVYWFRDGVDDWFFEGFDFAVLEPAPGQRQEEKPQITKED